MKASTRFFYTTLRIVILNAIMRYFKLGMIREDYVPMGAKDRIMTS